MHDDRALRYLVDVMGKDRVCLGTDYPFPLGELEPGKLIGRCNFEPETCEWLYSKAALQWLGLTRL